MEIAQILDRYSKLKATRDGCWLSVWREVRQYVMPTYSDFLTEGGARGEHLFDTTACDARARLAAGMYNWMAPPDKRWFELLPADEELQKDEEVKDFFSEVTRRIAFSMANSNWPSTLMQVLNNLACGLDGVVFCEDGGQEAVLNFRSFPIETVCYSENAKGRVDTLYREFEMSARHMLQEFGPDQLPGKIREEALDPRRQDKKHRILQAVFPRDDRDPGLLDGRNMAVADLYIDMESRQVIREAGYSEPPFAVCRFEKADNETYGRGPGLNKLPDIKMLNRMRQAYILASEFAADPSYLAPDGSIVGKEFDRSPGSVNFYKPDINGAKPEPVGCASNLVQLYQDIEKEREKIKLGFFWDIFDPLGDMKQITATEAEIRNEGKMVPFAPIAGNLHSELFRVIIHRVFGICQRRGILPQPPRQLLDHPDYKVEFVSKIALSIRKIESLGWLQTEASLANLVALKPDVMDNFDADAIVRGIAIANGVDPRSVLPEKEVARIREERALAQQQAQAAEAILAGAQTIGPNLGRKPESGSPLAKIMEGEGV